jgi:hypothetical protein
MKKLLALGFVLGFLPSALFAGNHPMAGCGLGYLVFKDNNERGPQILAATTNDLIVPQTSAITSGTSGCTQEGLMAKNVEAEVYAEVNLRELSRDMAAGEGEYLDAFSSLLGVTDKAGFSEMVQKNYPALFPSADTSSVEMLDAMGKLLSDRPELLG